MFTPVCTGTSGPLLSSRASMVTPEDVTVAPYVYGDSTVSAVAESGDSMESLLSTIAARVRPDLRDDATSAVDRLVESIVLDVVRYTLRWLET